MRRLEGVSGVALGVLGLVVAVALGIAITAAVRDDGGASPAPANRPATTIVGTTTAPAPTTTDDHGGRDDGDDGGGSSGPGSGSG